MADFPTYEDNANRPRLELEITPPAFDDNADRSKTDQAVFVEQQWRDVAADGGAGRNHPLSINRDAPEVTNDPYTT